MANDLSGKPIVVDTVDNNIAPKMKPIFIERIVWHEPVTPGDDLVINDANDRPIVVAECEIADQSQVFYINQVWDGLRVPTIGSGIAYIYWK